MNFTRKSTYAKIQNNKIRRQVKTFATHQNTSILVSFPSKIPQTGPEIFKFKFLGKMSSKNIYYSDKYTDEKFEYRHVMLPKDLAKLVPKSHLMSETEWRNLGVQQSQGWVHYMLHDPEPHILLFRRPISIYGNQQKR